MVQVQPCGHVDLQIKSLGQIKGYKLIDFTFC